MATNNESSKFNLLSIAGRLVRPYRKHFVILLAASLLQSVLTASTILLIAPLTELMMAGGSEKPGRVLSALQFLAGYAGIEIGIAHLFIAFGLLTLLVGFVSVWSRYVVLKIKFFVLVDLQANTMKQFLSASYSFFSSGEVGKLLNSFQKELDKLGDTLGLLVVMLVSSFQAIIYLTIPAILFPRLTFEFLVVGAIFSMPLLLLRRWSFRFGQESTFTANQVAKILHENLTSAKLIISFGQQQASRTRYLRELILHSKAAVRFGTLTAGVNLLFVPVGSVAAIIVIYRSMGDIFSLSALATALFAFFRALPLLGNVVQAKANIDGFVPAVQQVEELQDKARSLREKRGGKRFTELKDKIEFIDVKVTYPNGVRALDGVSFSIPSRKITALMGSSGAGKTTISDLVLGLTVPDSGEILIDGEALNSIDLQSLRSKVGYVPQEDFLFNSTIRENLLWSYPEATDSRIRETCDLVNINDFLASRSEGLDFIIGDRGSRLSGGQRQRLSIARALVKKPSILVLDEPTSALDVDSQSRISDALKILAKEVTILMIAHRPETIAISDQVVELKEGRIESIR